MEIERREVECLISAIIFTFAALIADSTIHTYHERNSFGRRFRHPLISNNKRSIEAIVAHI